MSESNTPPQVSHNAGLAVRRDVIAAARTLVVKVGTSVLSRDDDTLDESRMNDLARQLHAVRASGRQVVLVSSGAIGAGIGLLGLPGRPGDLPHLQAAAAVGQAHLIRRYDDCLQQYGYRAAQLLLTANDFKQRARYLNVRNTLRTLFEYNIIPIINENDTVSVDEIRFGDNDRLAALVSHLLDAPLVVILSVVDGLYDSDPRSPGSRVIRLVDEWDESLRSLATKDRSSRGTGGMHTKLESVRIATSVGENVIIASGRNPRVLDQILAGEEVGTLFLGRSGSLPAWKRWIGYSQPPRGQLVLDEGARAAVSEKGRSLLAIGVKGVRGDFRKGEVVSLVDAVGKEFARGLSNYSAEDLVRIAGQKTESIGEILGSCPYDEVIHRDNLVVLG
jgi:glutamate 5-kinase